MREGWTYKKLGEVATIIGGSTPKSNIEEYWGGSHYWVTPADLKGNKYQGATPRTITNLAIQKTNLQLLPTGTVLLSSRAPIGKVAITTVPMYCNQGFKNVVCSEQLLNEFVYWYLLNKTDYLNSLGRGATFKEISKKATEQIPIPVPPLSEQQRIVSELDLLSSIIEKKKAQLKEYDQLAQSIFFDMFGDPVTNEKGWEAKRLGEVCEVSSAKRVFIEEVVDSGVPFIRGTELTALSKLTRGEKMNYTLFITQEHYERLKAITGVPKVGDLLIPSINSDGIVWIVDTEEPLYFKDGRVLWVHVNNCVFSSNTLQRIMSYLIKNTFTLMNGATFAELKLFVLRDLLVPIPPLPLQQSFASKIEAIERQKALVQQSITEAETLFNSRMDYYFN